MATPTPVSKATSSSQNASTPQPSSHLNPFSSPLPRSVPSPANVRSQPGRSPLNATQSGASTAQNHPTGASNVSGRLAEGSPAGAIHSFESPAGMISSLSGFGFTEGGFPMAAGGSKGTKSTATLARRTAEDRLKRLEEVVSLLKACPSRLHPEGLEIIGHRNGFETILDPWKGTRDDGTRECLIAGENIGLDVKFQYNRVKSVDLTVPKSSDSMEKHIKAVEEVLHKNLTPSLSTISRSLDKFTRNMERLAKLDSLNSRNFNCFEAVTSMYHSLKKLYDHERKVALTSIHATKSNREERASREVMCKKSGRPLMNDQEEFGLKMQYWMQRRHVLQETPSKEPEIYSLDIECEPLTSSHHLPIRISENWISDAIEKQPENSGDQVYGPILDWQDPPPTYLSNTSSQDADAMALDNTNANTEGKLPNVIFVAKLDPPLPIPATVYNNLMAMVDMPADNIIWDGLYHHLAIGRKDLNDEAAAASAKEDIEVKRYLSTKIGGEEVVEEHDNELHIKTLAVGKLLREIPFSHPKQLVQLLPSLRQWAVIGALLRETFGAKDKLPHDHTVLVKNDIVFDVSLGRFTVCFIPPEADTSSKSSAGEVDLLADILSSNANDSSTSKEVTFDVTPNGGIALLNQSVMQQVKPDSSGDVKMEDGASQDKSDVIGKSLDITGDMDIWISWLIQWSKDQ